MEVKIYVFLKLWGGALCWYKKFTKMYSLVPRPHPAHARRKGDRSGVTSPSPETWSGQSNCRAAFNWNNAEARICTSIAPLKRVMRFINYPTLSNLYNSTLTITNFNTSASPRIQACHLRPFPLERVGSRHETSTSTHQQSWIWNW